MVPVPPVKIAYNPCIWRGVHSFNAIQRKRKEGGTVQEGLYVLIVLLKIN
jgi:hypothetical protein